MKARVGGCVEGGCKQVQFRMSLHESCMYGMGGHVRTRPVRRSATMLLIASPIKFSCTEHGEPCASVCNEGFENASQSRCTPGANTDADDDITWLSSRAFFTVHPEVFTHAYVDDIEVNIGSGDGTSGGTDQGQADKH